MPIYGYARVSTDDESLAWQDAQLRAAGCVKVYSEKDQWGEDRPARVGQGSPLATY